MFQREQLHPHADEARHAQLLAAVSNGPLTRSSKKLWAASDFMAPDRWQDEPEPQPLTTEQLAAQVAAINAGFD